MDAFIAAVDRQESMRLANFLTAIATGSQGSSEAVRKMIKALSC